MKTAQNPNKTAKIKPFAPVVVLVITHLPEMESEYHKGRRDVIENSLKTLVHNIGILYTDYNLIVWDNGSCKAWQYQLRKMRELRILDMAILSRNIGKTNALKSVMRMLPPGTILAYGDDDIEYFPNWLEPQIKILKTFPNVGTVTGWPVRITGTWGVDRTKNYARNSPTPLMEGLYAPDCEQGRFIPEEWERDYCQTVNRDWDGYKTITWGVNDYRITYSGVQAYAMSQHCQFVCYPERVEPLIPWTDDAMAAEIPFDKAVDAAGLLRLATVERYTRHIGNVLERTKDGIRD